MHIEYCESLAFDALIMEALDLDEIFQGFYSYRVI